MGGGAGAPGEWVAGGTLLPGRANGSSCRLADLCFRAASRVYPLCVIREGEPRGGEGCAADGLGSSGLATS